MDLNNVQVGYRGKGIVMSDGALAGFVRETAEGFGVAGAAAGVWADGREVFASHGVTSVENPLPVTQHTLFLIASVTIAGDGQRMGLRMQVRIKPEIRAAADKEPPPDPAPFDVGLLPRDEYVVTDGEYAGQRGFFTRDASGAVTGVDLAGRLATRV